MTTKNVYIISGLIFFLGFIAGGIVFSTLTVFSPGFPIPNPIDGSGTTIEPMPGDGGTIACSMDAKLCPDGSYVARSGPNCEFAECPTTTAGGQGSVCQSDGDCASGYECIDPSPVVREGYSNLRCWKKGAPHPICLSGDTRIGTPNGEVAAKDVKKGMKVWTLDVNGKKVAGTVLLTGKTFVPVGHKVIHLQLSDGRGLYLSPGHKVADGRQTGDLRAGDILDNVIIVSANLIPYTEEYTYDILPSGGTGMYFANGILLQSTLR